MRHRRLLGQTDGRRRRGSRRAGATKLLSEQNATWRPNLADHYLVVMDVDEEGWRCRRTLLTVAAAECYRPEPSALGAADRSTDSAIRTASDVGPLCRRSFVPTALGRCLPPARFVFGVGSE